MRRAAIFLALATLVVGSSVGVVRATGTGPFKFSVVPSEFDPFDTRLVHSDWENGTGCPSNAWTTPDGVTFDTHTDLACTSGDPKDKHHFGLLLVKTGPTGNFASATASLVGVKGITLTELGYDIRKNFLGTEGSHCGAGAPRFNVTTFDNVTHFVGCASPPGVPVATSDGWTRLRWLAAELLAAFPPIMPTDVVKSISIVFDEGQDLGPTSSFGAAILDNIDVNGVLVGRGPERQHEKDRDECKGEDKDHRHFSSHSSASRPESSGMSFADPNTGATVQMINGARSVSYAGACVTTVGDALFNDEPGHTVTFTACDLSALSTPLAPKIGTYSITVADASGVVYQQANALTSGKVTIHR
jgi:hypothetical protein